jgi:hypothetical protein
MPKSEAKPVRVAGEILSAGGDAKTLKGQKAKVLTAIAYGAPSTLASTPERRVNMCTKASAGCIASCLNTAGNGRYSNVQQARIKKTHRWLDDPEGFMDAAAKDLARCAKRAAKEGMVLHVRPDGTTDVWTTWFAARWDDLAERVHARLKGPKYAAARRVFEESEVYTYTKRHPSAFQGLQRDVHVTFSWSERPDAPSTARAWMARGANVAVVFRNRRTLEHYQEHGFLGRPVIDGDESDNRADDPQGVIVGLVAKGRAKKDTSGFVVDMP